MVLKNISYLGTYHLVHRIFVLRGLSLFKGNSHNKCFVLPILNPPLALLIKNELFLGRKFLNKMRYFIASLLLIFFASFYQGSNLSGQQRIRFKAYEVRATGLTIKGDLFQLKERLISPIAYTGTGLQLDIFRLMEGEYGRNYFNLGLNVDYAKNSLGLNVIYFQPEFVISHTRMTHMAYNDKQKILLGMAFSAKPRAYKFLKEDDNHLYWITSYTLDLHYILEQEIDRERKFWVEFQIPLVGVVFRPERDMFYTVQLPTAWEVTKRLHTNPTFASLHNMQSATLKAFIDLYAGERGALSVGYEADFFSFSKPVRASVLTHSFTIRLMFNRLVI